MKTMNTQKIFIVMCGLLLTMQTMKAQENMYVLGGNGAVDAIPTSQVNYSTFNADDSWFTITNDGLEGKTTNSISASCIVNLSESNDIKSISTPLEVGVCYSWDYPLPTIKDDCQTLGSTMGNYTFTLSSLFSGTVYYYRVYVKLGNEAIYGDVCNTQTLGTKPADNSKTINGHKFIDLGLPSGLLWAETNIGAETAYDDGNYYAWGETSPKEEYSEATYTTLGKYEYFNVDGDSLEYTKYTSTDGKTELELEDDAAYVNWGSGCRMPNQYDFDELYDTDNCTWTWVSRTNSAGETINCYKVVSVKNGNIIYLPASGYRYGGTLHGHGSDGNYWSSTLSTDVSRPYILNFFSSGHYVINFYFRWEGFPVRPVAEP